MILENASPILAGLGTNNIDHVYVDNKVGFASGKGLWYWFKIWDDGSIWFDHAYSQNIGVTRRGYRTASRACRVLLRLSK